MHHGFCRLNYLILSFRLKKINDNVSQLCLSHPGHRQARQLLYVFSLVEIHIATSMRTSQNMTKGTKSKEHPWAAAVLHTQEITYMGSPPNLSHSLQICISQMQAAVKHGKKPPTHFRRTDELISPRLP